MVYNFGEVHRLIGGDADLQIFGSVEMVEMEIEVWKLTCG